MTASCYGPLQIDRRIGSNDLFPLLQRAQVPVEMVTLPFGDAAFLGRGPDNTPVPVGVERKRLGDLVSSLMTGRLNGHQLPGLLASYQFTWLVVEGGYQVDEDGTLLVPRKRGWGPLMMGARSFRAEGLESWLLTVQLRGGVRVMHTYDAEHTARWLGALYAWWTEKSWDQHDGHKAMAQAIPEHDAVLLVKPTLVTRLAAQLPGIGYERAGAVGKRFPTALSMACASLADWTTIPGIGAGIGRRVVKLLQEGEH